MNTGMIKGTSFTLDMMRALKAFTDYRTAHPLAYPLMPWALVIVHSRDFAHYIRGMGRSLDIPMARVRIASVHELVEGRCYRGWHSFGLFVDHAVWEHRKPLDTSAELLAARSRSDYVYSGRPFNAAEVQP